MDKVVKDANGNLLTIGDIVYYHAHKTTEIIFGVVYKFNGSLYVEVVVKPFNKEKGNSVIMHTVGSETTTTVVDSLKPKKLTIIPYNNTYKEYPDEWLEEIFSNPNNIDKLMNKILINKQNVFTNTEGVK